MRKVFGIGLIVGLVWLGVTVFTEGTGGVLARLHLPGAPPPGAQHEAPIDRIRAKGQAARDAQMERVSYPGLVLWRSLFMLMTGIVFLPLLSLIARRDLAAKVTGLQLYRRNI